MSAKTLWPKVRSIFGDGEKQPILTGRMLRESGQHAPPFLLLSAFAVENALKGTKVKQILRRGDVPTFSARSKDANKPENVWGHDLPALAKDVGLTTDQLDDQMLYVLTRNIEWAGRYPGTDGKGGWFIPRYGSKDLQHIVRLINRIKRL